MNTFILDYWFTFVICGVFVLSISLFASSWPGVALGILLGMFVLLFGLYLLAFRTAQDIMGTRLSDIDLRARVSDIKKL